MATQVPPLRDRPAQFVSSNRFSSWRFFQKVSKSVVGFEQCFHFPAQILIALAGNVQKCGAFSNWQPDSFGEDRQPVVCIIFHGILKPCSGRACASNAPICSKARLWYGPGRAKSNFIRLKCSAGFNNAGLCTKARIPGRMAKRWVKKEIRQFGHNRALS
jgi:hypothetical protein